MALFMVVFGCLLGGVLTSPVIRIATRFEPNRHVPHVVNENRKFWAREQIAATFSVAVWILLVGSASFMLLFLYVAPSSAISLAPLLIGVGGILLGALGAGWILSSGSSLPSLRSTYAKGGAIVAITMIAVGATGPHERLTTDAAWAAVTFSSPVWYLVALIRERRKSRQKLEERLPPP